MVWRGLVVVVVVVVARLCELLKDSSDRVSPRGRTALKRAPAEVFEVGGWCAELLLLYGNLNLPSRTWRFQ